MNAKLMVCLLATSVALMFPPNRSFMRLQGPRADSAAPGLGPPGISLGANVPPPGGLETRLPPYQPWRQSQPQRFGPQMIADQWGELMKNKKLFPLLATLKFENGQARLRFEVSAITPEKIEDHDGALFQPPPNYFEIEPLPF